MPARAALTIIVQPQEAKQPGNGKTRPQAGTRPNHQDTVPANLDAWEHHRADGRHFIKKRCLRGGLRSRPTWREPDSAPSSCIRQADL